jgi:hypothetical protein
MAKRPFQPGDLVVYQLRKHSQSPGRRAHDIVPAPKGETYQYQVDKFWVVDELLDDRRLVVRTRRGKIHYLHATDPRLRHATWWEKRWHRSRFPKLDTSGKTS